MVRFICHPLGLRRGGSGFVGALAGAVAPAGHGDHEGAVDEAVEETLGDHAVGEEGVEVLGLAVGGEDERAALVAAAHEFVQVFGLDDGVLAHGEIVQDE